MPITNKSEEYGSVDVLLENTRLSFPHLFTPSDFAGDGKDLKYEATFLVEEGDENFNAMKEAIKFVIQNKLKGKKPSADKICMKDSSDKDLEGYGEGVYSVKARNKDKINVVDRDPSIRLDAEDGKPYAGCYVNAHIRVYGQDNQYGKRVNAVLQAVQFSKDGEPFGGGSAPDPTKLFGVVDGGGGGEGGGGSDEDEDDFLN